MPLLTGKTIDDLPASAGLSGAQLIEVENASGFSTKVTLAALATYIQAQTGITPAHGPWRGYLWSKAADTNGLTFPLTLGMTLADTLVNSDGVYSELEPTMLTIPEGVSKVRIGAMVLFETLTTAGSVSVTLMKNGVELPITAVEHRTTSGFTTNAVHLPPAVHIVEEGDYFQFRLNASVAGHDQVLAGSYVQLEFVEVD